MYVKQTPGPSDLDGWMFLTNHAYDLLIRLGLRDTVLIVVNRIKGLDIF